MTDLSGWVTALEARHLANLTRPELTRALRALSSCYVERRGKLGQGAALESAGKRAAFALYYAPLHFVTIDAIVRAVGADSLRLQRLVDLGCGTGAAGAAWALACGEPPTIHGVDRSGWALQEAAWTYRHFQLRGRATHGNLVEAVPRDGTGTAVLLAYAVNELSSGQRDTLLDNLMKRSTPGSPVLIVEPIARRLSGWWDEWCSRLGELGARTDSWRFSAALPPLVRDLAQSAGLGVRELTAKSIFVGVRGAGV